MMRFSCSGGIEWGGRSHLSGESVPRRTCHVQADITLLLGSKVDQEVWRSLVGRVDSLERSCSDLASLASLKADEHSLDEIRATVETRLGMLDENFRASREECARQHLAFRGSMEQLRAETTAAHEDLAGHLADRVEQMGRNPIANVASLQDQYNSLRESVQRLERASQTFTTEEAFAELRVDMQALSGLVHSVLGITEEIREMYRALKGQIERIIADVAKLPASDQKDPSPTGAQLDSTLLPSLRESLQAFVLERLKEIDLRWERRLAGKADSAEVAHIVQILGEREPSGPLQDGSETAATVVPPQLSHQVSEMQAQLLEHSGSLRALREDLAAIKAATERAAALIDKKAEQGAVEEALLGVRADLSQVTALMQAKADERPIVQLVQFCEDAKVTQDKLQEDVGALQEAAGQASAAIQALTGEVMGMHQELRDCATGAQIQELLLGKVDTGVHDAAQKDMRETFKRFQEAVRQLLQRSLHTEIPISSSLLGVGLP
ncbi:hypothetical protein PAPYR_12602 [Paratrimastix pyriformis]|uniref:Uncharacterized protein n=1 Tax=Paratrimastix pyriformis TaxID=342808 RepID=A0ABQ8U5E6_9EUKA|nr:hypothetical protein PAPYR_12602 [Paratrimastix pyriformis]